MPFASSAAKRHATLLAALLLASLLALGCGHMPRMLGGTGDLELRLDGEQLHEESLRAGSVVVLDMRDPGQSGYQFAGTSFDTNLLRLEGIEPVEGGKRVRYTFTALAEGECEIQIKIRKPEPGYRPDVFKRVRLTIVK